MMIEAPVHVETRVDVGADRFEYQLSDVDGDDRLDLFVTTATAGERTLRLWRQRADATLPQEPDFRMAVPPDVVSWSVLDLRPEPGREVVLLTRGGVFSLTTTQAGLQGNLRRELALPLFPDLADPERLPCWRLVQDVDGDGREELLVVSEGHLLALGMVPDEQGATKLRPVLDLEATDEIVEDETAELSVANSGIHVRSRAGLHSLFPGARSSRPVFTGERLFAQRRGFKLPALLDWNGDGRLDSVRFASRSATVSLRQPDGSFEPGGGRTIRFPAGAADGGEGAPESAGGADGADGANGAGDGDGNGRRPPRALARLLDCDGDGRDELVLDRDESEGLSQSSIALVFPRDAEGRPAETPSARVKLPGMDVDFELADVDRDGRLELLARTLDIPTGLTTLATIRLDVGFYVFRGLPGAALSREPEIRFERSFRPEQLARVQETLLTRLDGDFDGDGTCDLVCTQLDGRLELRRVVARDGRLVLEEKPFSSFLPAAPVSRMETWDVSDDGVADLVLRHERGFTFFISRRRAGR